jgi:agmatinase
MICVVPGINGLGKTAGCENSFNKIEYSSKIKLDLSDVSLQLKQIKEGSKNFFDSNDNVIFFGGDHSISYALVSNFYEKFGEKGKLLVFDAHPDLMNPMVEPTHEEWLRAVIEEGFNPGKILLVGIRRNSKNVDETEIKYAKERGLKIIYSDEFDRRKSEILEFVGSGKIYCSFDIDVFDSSIISSTGYPEEEGLMLDQIFDLIDSIKEKIDFFDLVEVNLEKGTLEERERTIQVVRKILKTLS